MNHLASSASAQHPTAATAWLVKWNGHMSDGVGATNGVEPLAFLAAAHDELILSGTRGTFRFPATVVRKIGRGGLYPWLFRAIRIHHSVTSYPAELQFKPTHATVAEILSRLEQLGFRRG